MCCEEKKAAEKVPEIHTVIHPVTAEEVTLQKTLRISAMLALFQNIAGEDVDRLGYGDEGFRKEGILWMLTRMRTKISRMPRYGETVVVSTWTGVSGHGLYTRHYAISDRTGCCLVQACGIWVLVDGSDGEMLSARTDGGRLVRFSGPAEAIGTFRDVTITGNTTWSLLGEEKED